MATIPLRLLSDFVEKMPVCRNLRGYLYLNLNSYTSTITTNASGNLTGPPIVNAKFGRTNPAMFRYENNGDSQAFQPSTSAANTWELTCEVNGVPSTMFATPATRQSISPPINYCRLLVPKYSPNPAIDNLLSQKKTIRYLEYQATEFTLQANSGITTTLSPGLSNVKSVLLVPYFTELNGTSISPWTSCFSSAPATTSPYAALKNIQVQIGNTNLFANNINYGADMFLQEIAEGGIDGGKTMELSSGLLSKDLWETWYRYVYVNCARRLSTDDGNSKSVIVSCDNATSIPMRVLAFIHYEKEVVVDTNLCQLTSGRM